MLVKIVVNFVCILYHVWYIANLMWLRVLCSYVHQAMLYELLVLAIRFTRRHHYVCSLVALVARLSTSVIMMSSSEHAHRKYHELINVKRARNSC